MARLNRKELKSLEKRELQLSILAAVFVLVQAGGMALLMYPMVFLHPEEGNKWTMRSAFGGFIVLTLLFVTYLFDRQRTMRKLKPRCSSSARKYSAQLALSKTQTSPMVTASG